MPKVSIRRVHKTTLDDAKQKARGLVDKFQESYSKYLDRVDWAPDGASATAKGKGFTASFAVDGQAVSVVVDLNFLLTALAGKVETNVNKNLDATFGPA